jgi:uncharacterized membrane protein
MLSFNWQTNEQKQTKQKQTPINTPQHHQPNTTYQFQSSRKLTAKTLTNNKLRKENVKNSSEISLTTFSRI